MRRQVTAVVTAAPSASGDKRVEVRCENLDCRLNQFMTKNGLCRKCKEPLPSEGTAWVAPSVPHPKNTAERAMQLALGKQFEKEKKEPF